MNHCESCSAVIEWARTDIGKWMPLDPEVPAPPRQADLFAQPAAAPTDLRGKLVLLNGVVRPATAEDVRLLRPLRVSHFSTCPNAAQHRRSR